MTDRGVLQVCVVGGAGGVEHHVSALSKAMAAQRDVVVVAAEGGWLARAARDAGLQTLTIPEPHGNFDIRTVRALRRAIASNRERIVHSHLGRSDWYTWIASAGMPDVRLVTTEHGISSDRPDLFVRGVRRRLHEYAHAARLRRMNAVVAVSESTARALVERYPDLGTCPPAVIAPGIEASAYSAIERKPWSFGNPLRILVVSRLAPEKGVDVAIHAFAELRSQGVDASLVIVGGGPEESTLRDWSRSLRCDADVHFVGQVDAVGPFLAKSDVFLMMSRSENLPIALLEAMASGLPAVAASVGGIPEVVGDSGAAILIAPEDWGGAAAALSGMTRANPSISAMGISARKAAAAYDMSVTVTAIGRVYEELG